MFRVGFSKNSVGVICLFQIARMEAAQGMAAANDHRERSQKAYEEVNRGEGRGGALFLVTAMSVLKQCCHTRYLVFTAYSRPEICGPLAAR